MPSPPTRPIELLRGAWGAALLLAPRRVLEGVGDRSPDRRAVRVARILGARHLTQALLSGLRPTPEVLAMGVWVDAVHAVTAAALAGVDRDRARTASADSVVAAGWAALGRHTLLHDPPPTAGRQRRRDVLARAVLRRAPGGSSLLAACPDSNRPGAARQALRLVDR